MSIHEYESARDAFLAAARTYAIAKAGEMEMEHLRPVAKHAAILRLMQTENPLTKKAHSASSAEQQVELDSEYADYLHTQRGGVVVRILEEAKRDAARCNMTVAVASIGGAR